VGKTLSARHYAKWDKAETYAEWRSETLFREVSIATTVFYLNPAHSQRRDGVSVAD